MNSISEILLNSFNFCQDLLDEMIEICLDFLYEEEVTFMEAISKCAARGQGFEKFFDIKNYKIIIIKILKIIYYTKYNPVILINQSKHQYDSVAVKF